VLYSHSVCVATDCIRSKINERESRALFSLDTPVAVRVDPDTPITHHHVIPRPQHAPVPPPRVGSISESACYDPRNDDYLYDSPQLERAAINIRKLSRFTRHIHNTRHEVDDELMRLYEPMRTIHNRRMQARAEIMCALRDLNEFLDSMFSSSP